MDIEFHYYMTHLIASKAGFNADDALKIAHSSQYVDDNDMIFEIDKDKATYFKNYISQTMNILKPKSKLFRIYPLFHFIPGDPQCENANRKDGKMHWLNTTPNSKNANAIFDKALATNSLHRIGIALHSFADTWAHQNFIGYYDDFNAMSSPLSKAIPNIGHADAKHNPDWPALVWQDKRLLNSRRDNRSIFIEAATTILAKLARYKSPDITEGGIAELQESLAVDLRGAIGDNDQSNDNVKSRIERYTELASKPDYGNFVLPEYDHDLWFEQTVNEHVRGLRDRSDNTFTRWDPLNDRYTWRGSNQYAESDWYLFQIAVKEHQKDSLVILNETNMSHLDLPKL